MGEPMALRDEDIGRIGDYVKPWLRNLVDNVVPRVEPGGVGSQLLERMVRVEEELKAQRQLMDERFGFMERRFEAVDKRFDAVDKRFEELLGHANSRFDEVGKRFDEHLEHTNIRFADLTGQMNARFTALTWMIGVGFVVITSLTTLYALLA